MGTPLRFGLVLAAATIVACEGVGDDIGSTVASAADGGEEVSSAVGDAGLDWTDGPDAAQEASSDATCADGNAATFPPGHRRCSSDADCESGMRCAQIVAGGWFGCVDVHPVVTSCSANDPVASDCGCIGNVCEAGTECYADPELECGHLRQLCLAGCVSDADCAPGEACLAAGAMGPVATCAPADCRTDADCGCQRCDLAVAFESVHCPYVQRFGLRCTCDGEGDCRSERSCRGFGSPFGGTVRTAWCS